MTCRCVLGSLFAAFAPGAVYVYGLLAAGGGIFLSFVTSWIVTIRNGHSRNSASLMWSVDRVVTMRPGGE